MFCYVVASLIAIVIYKTCTYAFALLFYKYLPSTKEAVDKRRSETIITKDNSAKYDADGIQFKNIIKQKAANEEVKRMAEQRAYEMFEGYLKYGRTAEGRKNDLFSPNGHISVLPPTYYEAGCIYNGNDYSKLCRFYYDKLVADYETAHPYTI